MKKVLIVTYYWPPSGGAGVQRWLKFTKYLPEFGYEPVIITVDPALASYPQKDETLNQEVPGTVHVFHTKTFELYNLYKFLFRKREIPYGGFANEKEPGWPQILIRMARSHFLIPDPRKGWNKFAYRKAKEIIKLYSIDTVITTSPPHSSQLIGLKLKKKLNINWIADLRDPWTDIFYYKSLYHSPISSAIDRMMEKQVLLHADSILTVSRTLKENFASKLTPQVSDKFYVIPNGFDEEDFKLTYRGTNQKFIITYTGTLTNDYKIDSFLEAIAELINESVPVKIQFVGKAPQSLKEKAEISGLTEHINYFDYVPHHQSVKYLMESNALLLIIPDVKNNKGILTGKLFEYIGSGKPIIGIGPVDSDASFILNETQTGKMTDYPDKENLKALIMEYYQCFKNNIHAINPVYPSRYSRFELTRELAGILDKIPS